jgi:hypothetical protein
MVFSTVHQGVTEHDLDFHPHLRDTGVHEASILGSYQSPCGRTLIGNLRIHVQPQLRRNLDFCNHVVKNNLSNERVLCPHNWNSV